MDMKKAEDIKDTALKLGEIKVYCPEDYFYLKGWIHCLLQRQDEKSRQMCKPGMRMAQTRQHAGL